MERKELIEWIIIIAVIVASWPWILGPVVGIETPSWYGWAYCVASLAALIVIFVLRLRRMEKGLEYSQKVMDDRHKASGANILGYPAGPTGAPPQPSDDTANRADAESAENDRRQGMGREG